MSELRRPLKLDRIGAHGLGFDVTAQPDELGAVATRLLLPAVHTLSGTFQLRRISGGIVQADGVLRARVDQECVVTLDPFTQAIEERFSVQFVPAEREDPDPDPDAVDQIPYEGSSIDLGEALVEQLALALDPYPRKPGATLEATITGATPDPHKVS